MAIDKKTIKNLLRYLEEEIKVIEQSHVTRETLDEEENRIFTDATKYRMQIAVEIVINISEHVVAGLNLGKPEFAKQLFPFLVKKEILKEDLSENLQKAVGLRNVLVHLYKEVDLEILTESATIGLNDLRGFARAINDFLEKQNSNPPKP